MDNNEFMQQMLRKADNRRRAEWGLQPLPTTSEPITRAGRAAVAPEQPAAGFNGRVRAPLPLRDKK